MTKTEKKIQKRLMIGGFTSGAEMRRAIKMLRKLLSVLVKIWKLVRQRRLCNAVYSSRSSC